MRPSIRDNAIASAIRTGTRARGFHMTVAVPTQIELLGTLGFDFVYLDAEHGSFEASDIEHCCRAAELYDLTVVARVPLLDANLLSRYLDAGVQGIVVPHVDTVAEARLAIESCRYAPEGLRPGGGSRATGFWKNIANMTEALEKANREVTLTVQIESFGALELLEDMIALGGIDYFTIGKQDLAQSMGFRRLQDGLPPEVVAAADRATKLIHAKGGLLKDDVMTLCRVNQLLTEGARGFLERSRNS